MRTFLNLHTSTSKTWETTSWWIKGIGVACLWLASLPSAKATPALSFTGLSSTGVVDRTAGYKFSVDQNFAVTQLGLYDHLGDGNEEIRNIGLWNSSGALLGSVTMPAELVGSLIDDFRYLPLDAPIFVTPGETYMVGVGYTTAAGGVFMQAQSLTTIDGFNFLTNVVSKQGTGFVQPTNMFGSSLDPGFFGPNLELGPIETQLPGRTPALSFTGLSNIDVTNQTAGYTFSLNEIKAVTELGFFDPSGDGSKENRPIGLWDSNGTLMASVTVATGSVGTRDEDFRYLPLNDPILLFPGETYTVGVGYTATAGEVVMQAQNLTTTNEFNYLTNVISNQGTGFIQPTNTLGSGFDSGFFGPNLRFATIPEASTITLALLASLILTGCVRWQL